MKVLKKSDVSSIDLQQKGRAKSATTKAIEALHVGEGLLVGAKETKATFGTMAHMAARGIGMKITCRKTKKGDWLVVRIS